MRVDKGNAGVAFDNMMDRPIKGTKDWHSYSVILDVPQDATGIFLGILLDRTGAVWLNGVQFDVVGADVPATQVGSSGSSQLKGPANLTFEE